MCQEVAVQASSRAGWTPKRLFDLGAGFVVSDMTVEHFRELEYSEKASAQTWIRDFRRGMLTHREIRLSGDQGPLARATQRWVHIHRTDSGALQIGRASDAVLADFRPVSTPAPEAQLPAPAVQTELGRSDQWELDVWETWMDPNGHVNHPMYVDFGDEALARTAAEAGVDPQQIFPVAERVRFRQGAVAGDRLVVETTAVGALDGGEVVFEQVVRRAADSAILAQLTLIRGHHTDPDAWRMWWAPQF
jgi:acyl-CoA thioesterase FadM